jgi:hypothetical protein
MTSETIHWHRTADVLPETDEDVLFYFTKAAGPWVGFRRDGWWFSDDSCLLQAAPEFWAALPKGMPAGRVTPAQKRLLFPLRARRARSADAGEASPGIVARRSRFESLDPRSTIHGPRRRREATRHGKARRARPGRTEGWSAIRKCARPARVKAIHARLAGKKALGIDRRRAPPLSRGRSPARPASPTCPMLDMVNAVLHHLQPAAERAAEQGRGRPTQWAFVFRLPPEKQIPCRKIDRLAQRIGAAHEAAGRSVPPQGPWWHRPTHARRRLTGKDRIRVRRRPSAQAVPSSSRSSSAQQEGSPAEMTPQLLAELSRLPLFPRAARAT